MYPQGDKDKTAIREFQAANKMKKKKAQSRFSQKKK